MSQAIGIDLGGTRIKGVLLDTHTGVVIQQRITPTNDGDGNAWQTGVAQTFQALKNVLGN